MSIGTAAGFARRLGTGYKAGAELTLLLQAEAKGGSTRHRQAMLDLIDGVKVGDPLSKTMEASGGYFPRLLVSMTRVGELTGRLERTLAMVASHFEHRVAIRRSFLMGIAWPMLQLIAGIFVIALLILLLGILTPPTGGEMMDVTGFGLRGPGGALIFLSLCGLFFACVGATIFAVRKDFLGIQNLVPLFYMIPVFGPAIRTITLARFCWVLSLTLDTGLDVIRSVTLALDSTGSEFYRAGTKAATEALQRGQSLSKSLRAAEVLPDDFLVQLEVAELSGTDAESLETLALEYDERARAAIKTISGMMSVAIWIFVVVVIVFMMFRMLMNIGNMYSEALSPL